MQLQTLLSALIVLPALVSAQGLVHVTRPGVTKRSPFALEMQPHYIAKRGFDHVLAARDVLGRLQKRQCPSNYYACSNLNICCPTGTTCGTFGGEKGCCPNGKICDRVEGCSKGEVDCKTFCCPGGTTCGTASNGEPTCNTGGGGGGDNGECGVKGYSPCKNMQGCCPTGVDCIPPNKCDLTCKPSDPRCGDGCCLPGSKCTSELTCVVDDGPLTSITRPSTTGTRTSTNTRSITTTRTITTRISTSTTSTRFGPNTTNDSSETDAPTLGSDIDTTTRSEVSTQGQSTGGAAGAGSVEGGLVGLIVGALGYIAL